MRSPADWLATSVLVLALVALAFDLVARLRLARRGAATATDAWQAAFWSVQAAAGTAVGAVLVDHASRLHGIVGVSGPHGVSFAVYPVEPARLAVVVGLLAATAVGRVAVGRRCCGSRRPGGGSTRSSYTRRTAMAVVYLGTALAAAGWWRGALTGTLLVELLPPLALVLAAAGAPRWVIPRYRHASQASRLTVAYLALVLPTVAFYPALVSDERGGARAHDRRRVRARGAEPSRRAARAAQPLARAARRRARRRRRSLSPTSHNPARLPTPTARIFLWSQTELGRQRLTSSVELYDARRRSRQPVRAEPAGRVPGDRAARRCRMRVGRLRRGPGVDRRSGAAACRPGRLSARRHEGRRDSRARRARLRARCRLSPTAIRPPRSRAAARSTTTRTHGRPIAFAVYGWGRTPVYPDGGHGLADQHRTAAERIYRADRRSFWEVLSRGDRRYRVLLEQRPRGHLRDRLRACPARSTTPSRWPRSRRSRALTFVAAAGAARRRSAGWRAAIR